MGGGIPFCMLTAHQSGIPFPPPFPAFIGANFQTIVAKVAKMNFFLLAFVFSRGFRRPEGAKFKIYLIFEGCRGFRCGSLFGAVVVSTGCRWSGSLCYFADVSKNVLMLSILACSLPFPALLVVCWLEIWLYFAF